MDSKKLMHKEKRTVVMKVMQNLEMDKEDILSLAIITICTTLHTLPEEEREDWMDNFATDTLRYFEENHEKVETMASEKNAKMKDSINN